MSTTDIDTTDIDTTDVATTDVAGATALVTGAGRGFGRAVAASLAKAGATVVGVARTREQLQEVRDELGDSFVPVAADAAAPDTAGRLIDAHRPTILVLNAGAAPLARPLHLQTWETFSQNWEVDVQHAFHWLREALLKPLDRGSTVVTVSSGAALRGSPMSGGYAGAKATIRFITAYAAEESMRADLGIRFHSVLPPLTPATELGRGGVAGYAARQGVDVAEFLRGYGPTVTADQVGEAISGLIIGSEYDQDAYRLTADGLVPLG
jgi:NAD(P)-dependent dehydrogenase (short-subunit alcohol dehydrogenase family)